MDKLTYAMVYIFVCTHGFTQHMLGIRRTQRATTYTFYVHVTKNSARHYPDCDLWMQTSVAKLTKIVVKKRRPERTFIA